MKRFTWVINAFIACFLLANTATASNEKAEKFAESIGTEVLSLLHSDADKAQKETQLRALFTSYVDTEWVGRFVLGHHWRSLNESQKSEYLKRYKQFLANSYTKNFEAYGENTTFDVTQSKPLKRKGQYLVEVNVVKNMQPIKVDYRLRQKNSTFKIIDIVVEGVSLLATQRSEFSAVVQRKGADYLIEKLHSKIH